MKKLTLPEFRDSCKSRTFSDITFATSNQSWNNVDLTFSSELSFKDMIITFNPNIIHLKNGKKILNLNGVRSVKLHDEDVFGTIFTVVCGGLHPNSQCEYTLIAR